eukprot:1510606-Karenia_brevis.AAC.1
MDIRVRAVNRDIGQALYKAGRNITGKTKITTALGWGSLKDGADINGEEREEEMDDGDDAMQDEENENKDDLDEKPLA